MKRTRETVACGAKVVAGRGGRDAWVRPQNTTARSSARTSEEPVVHGAIKDAIQQYLHEVGAAAKSLSFALEQLLRPQSGDRGHPGRRPPR